MEKIILRTTVLVALAMIFLIDARTSTLDAELNKQIRNNDELLHLAHESETIIHGLHSQIDRLNETIDDNQIAYKRLLQKKNKKITQLQNAIQELDERFKTVEATAYTAFCDTGCIGITATGYDVSDTIYYEGYRIIAVDPNVIPLYSIVLVKTRDKEFKAIALDTGGAIKGNKIDVLVDTKKYAYYFGRQPKAEIFILRYGKGEAL